MAGGLITVLRGEFAAELAGVGDGAIVEGELAGGEYRLPVDRLIGSHGGGCRGQGKVEFSEFGFDAHGEGRGFSSVWAVFEDGRATRDIGGDQVVTTMKNARRFM